MLTNLCVDVESALAEIKQILENENDEEKKVRVCSDSEESRFFLCEQRVLVIELSAAWGLNE